jgi:uncharacterized membrane protein YeiH
MDLFGVLVLAVVTATGGGTLRDILLGDSPPFCFKDETYLYISIAVGLGIFLFHRRLAFLQHPLLYFDAIGLGTFVVIGTGKALEYHMGFIGAVMMGVITATAGGAVRDVLSNQIPLILRKEIYASACLAGGALLFLLHQTSVDPRAAALVAALTVIGLRLLAIRHNWALPRARS